MCVFNSNLFAKAVSTVDVAVVLPVEGGIDRAVFSFFFFFVCFLFFPDHKLLRRAHIMQTS